MTTDAGARGSIPSTVVDGSDAAISELMDAAGGPDEFLERYAVVICSDHGQSKVEQVARLDAGDDLVTASNRAGQVYLLPDARFLASNTSSISVTTLAAATSDRSNPPATRSLFHTKADRGTTECHELPASREARTPSLFQLRQR